MNTYDFLESQGITRATCYTDGGTLTTKDLAELLKLYREETLAEVANESLAPQITDDDIDDEKIKRYGETEWSLKSGFEAGAKWAREKYKYTIDTINCECTEQERCNGPYNICKDCGGYHSAF